MLIRFTVENFLSFNTLVDFNLIASAEAQQSHHVIRSSAKEHIDLLRTSLIYGANASGKSNLIKAMDFAKNFIVSGVAKNRTIPIKPFKLDSQCHHKPARFEFEFRCQGKQYAYGFAINNHQVVEEWLFEMGHQVDIPVFERVNNNFEFNFKHPIFAQLPMKEKREIRYEARGTRSNLLFLTNCQERNIDWFKSIYQWFNETLVIVFTTSKHQALTSLAKLNLTFFNQIIQSFDFGISRLHIAEIDFANSQEIPAAIKEKIQAEFPYGQGSMQFVSVASRNYLIEEDDNGELRASKLTTIRKDTSGKEVSFEIAEESEGTQRLLDFIPLLIGLARDKVFVIDEIERSLHTLLTKKFFDLILNHKLFRSAPSQLIASTHEVNLLDIKKLFRKDEIWFVEKAPTGESLLYSLANAEVDNLNIINGYLKGRFGAIPFIKDVRDLGWEK